MVDGPLLRNMVTQPHGLHPGRWSPSLTPTPRLRAEDSRLEPGTTEKAQQVLALFADEAFWDQVVTEYHLSGFARPQAQCGARAVPSRLGLAHEPGQGRRGELRQGR